MAGSSLPSRICWDTCVFVAWLEEDQKRDLDAIDYWLQFIERGDVALLIPTVVVGEMRSLYDIGDAGRHFERLLDRPNVLPVNLTVELALEAARLCHVFPGGNGTLKGLKPPDAMIIATAKALRVDTLMTFDGGLLGKSGHPELGICIAEPIRVAGVSSPAEQLASAEALGQQSSIDAYRGRSLLDGVDDLVPLGSISSLGGTSGASRLRRNCRGRIRRGEERLAGRSSAIPPKPRRL